jgi:valyl-tRNA synthetase
MPHELPIHFDYENAHKQVYPKWRASGALHAEPDERDERYVIMMPLPNVTGALHMGHAMDNIMQDLLIRYNRMQGKNTLWMPGCDHAGIATQAVVEKRLFELEGKTRHDIGREALVGRIWRWKDEYQARIIDQQQRMGCSCDWDLHRFTMDAVCARAVREAFFRMFKDGLIYRGNRLVNWDAHLQTAVSDDEIYREKVAGHFWHLKYPIVNPQEGEPTHLVVATTRPDTMLGDTAVAVHPDPAGSMRETIAATEERLRAASPKDRPFLESELERLNRRLETHLPLLETLREMADAGRTVMLPLMERELPLIKDEWAKPALGSGCVKITPAHDPNDYEVWERHREEIGIVNLLNPDGTYNDNAGRYAGLDRAEVRERVLQDLEAKGLILEVEDREIELGFSDRSKTPIEPYVSKQWFVNMGDIPGGIVCGRGGQKEFRADGLAQVAIDAVSPQFESPTGRRLTFHPDPERYKGTFVNWLAEKRDWCISRQLWWGHQIPIWHGRLTRENRSAVSSLVDKNPERLWAWLADDRGELYDFGGDSGPEESWLLVCIRREEDQAQFESQLTAVGLNRDPDVLDTWFSSGLWPFSTLGWPDPETADVGPDHAPLGGEGAPGDYLDYYYPGSCLVTGRDIITLWVARMTILGLYLLGDVPFTDCFIHANVQDGKGERMSKSKGNGIDPVDIIGEYGVDAMRYVVCDMQTGTQDIKLPVQAVSPFTDKRVDLAEAKHGRTVFTYIDPDTGEEFDVLGTIEGLPKARVTSDRFEVGKAFCTKLWNASRFAFMNIEDVEYARLTRADLAGEDQWILSRLAKTIAEVSNQLEEYNPSAAVAAARDFFWGDLCDWYLEIIKPRLSEGSDAHAAQSVLSYCLDRTLRLFHPFVPYITETLWKTLNERSPRRGIDGEVTVSELLISAEWPIPHTEHVDEEREVEIALVQEFVRAVRDLRRRYNIGLSQPITARVRAGGQIAQRLAAYKTLIANLVNIESFEVSPDIEKPPLSATAVLGESEIYLLGLVDPEKERAKLGKQRDKLLKDVEKLEKKLANTNFTEKAPAAVVEKERSRLEEARGELQIVERSLAELEE